MMTTWLVIDLRCNHCAAGLLDISRGSVDWYTEGVFSVHASPEVSDSTKIADLCFFRRKGKRKWSPIQRDALPELHQESGYETIEVLFAEPPERLPDLFRNALWSLLKDSFKLSPDLPLLLLLDQPEIASVLEDFLRLAIKEREFRICIVPGNYDSLAGFALLGFDTSKMPETGTRLFCRLGDETTEKRQVLSYVWTDYRFEASSVSSDTPSAGSDLRQWESSAEMAQVGAALFALFWQSHLADYLTKQVQTLTQALWEKQDLVTRLKQLYQQLIDDTRWHHLATQYPFQTVHPRQQPRVA